MSTPDESSPRKPHDPAWRSRTARRSLDPRAAAALKSGRQARGWSISETAKRTGVARRHIGMLEQGQRRPSGTVAEILIRAYQLDGEDATIIRSITVELAGRDSPYRAPSPSTAARTDL